MQEKANFTEQVAKLLVQTRFSDLPLDAVGRAKDLILDFIGVCFGGTQTLLGKKVMEHVKDMSARAEAGVIGGKFGTTAAYSAYANSVLNHVLEFEAVGMDGPNICQDVAVALAMGEKLGLSGEKVIEALVVGREVQGKVNRATAGAAMRTGFVLVFNYVGAVATASKILGLDADKTKAAFGLCLAQAGDISGTESGKGGHYFAFARPARAAIEAAEYASEGITGTPNIFEEPQGFCDLYCGKGAVNYEKMARYLTENWGKPFSVLPPGVLMKKYPCCFLNHGALDAVLGLIKEHNIRYEDIESVKADIGPAFAAWLRFSDPQDRDQARFSLEHALGTAILEGKAELESFTDESVRSQRYKEARNKVTVEIHTEWTPGLEGGSVDVRLKDGRTYPKELATPGEQAREEVVARYKKMAQPILSPPDIDRSIEMIENLEKLDNISRLMALVTG